MMEHDEHSPCKISEHKHYTPTRCSAKRKQEQVNLFQTKLEIEIFKDVILPKCCTLIVLRYIEEEKDESDLKNRPVQVPEDTTKQTRRVKNGPVEVKNGPVQRNLHNVLLRNAMKAQEDFFESSSSPLSNVSSLISFGRYNQELCLD